MSLKGLKPHRDKLGALALYPCMPVVLKSEFQFSFQVSEKSSFAVVDLVPKVRHFLSLYLCVCVSLSLQRRYLGERVIDK